MHGTIDLLYVPLETCILANSEVMSEIMILVINLWSYLRKGSTHAGMIKILGIYS